MNIYQKALRARTIIPDNLYVDRDADRQLNDVIEEMGRPGYILVARQMGKTNLLLRMKRSREALGDLAVYVDLSNSFGDARGLFRNLIDSLLDTQPSLDLRIRIEVERKAEALDPSVEYDRHLRSILTAVKKDRVIIILDEIDSLVGKPYSDRILSQIRSMYFARANFPVYEHLTYILSGVAEPTDLIKDKNISPFNIGEKIYLSDFSKEEVSVLLRNANIKLGLDVQEAVYNWISGNPRMTWDVYSALEDSISASETIGVETVESIISKLYLTRYDRAPLDHIRALAENDTDVRGALVSLLYGKGNTLDDRSRSKLYLAGITTASANEAPKIKNRVIEHALSETWLSQVEAGRKGLLKAAERRYLNAAYVEAIDLFKQFFDAGGSVDVLEDLEILRYGMALYHTGNYREAIPVLDRASKYNPSSEVRSMLSYHIGFSTMLMGHLDEAITVFKTLANTPGPYRLRARHAQSTAYLKASIQDHQSEIIEINEQVLNEISSDASLTDKDKAEIIAAAHYNLGQVYAVLGRTEQAKEAFQAAYGAAAVTKKPAFASVILNFAETPAELGEILAEVSDILFREDIPYTTSPEMLGFSQRHMAELMTVALKLQRGETLWRLLDIAQKRSGTNSFETTFALAMSLDWKSNLVQIKTLLRWALEETSIASEALLKQKLNAMAVWLASADGSDREAAFRTYWSLIREPEALEFMSLHDTIALSNWIAFNLESENLANAKLVVDFVRESESTFTSVSGTMFAFFVYHEMVVHKRSGDFVKVLKTARELLALTSRDNLSEDVNAINQIELFDNLYAIAMKEVRALMPPLPKFGRNEFVTVVEVKTGVRRRTKFKKIVDKILSGEFELLGSDC